MKFGRRKDKKKGGVSKDETPLAGKKRPPEGYGVCKYCLVKNGHAGWCPMIS